MPGVFQRSWREFYDNKNRAATVIQTAWRSSLKHKSEKDDGTDKTRPGRSRYTFYSACTAHVVELNVSYRSLHMTCIIAATQRHLKIKRVLGLLCFYNMDITQETRVIM